jgi:hypothetical protein
MKRIYNQNEELFKCIYDIISRILSYKDVTILICESEITGYCTDVFVRSLDRTARGYNDTETATYMFKSVFDIEQIIRSVLDKLANTLDINVVDWWCKQKTLRHLEFNGNSLFREYELRNNEYKLNGLQFIITQNKPYESNRATETTDPVKITHTLDFNSNESDQYLYYNIPIKDTTPPIPAVLCICANIQLGYSPTPDITIYNKYDMRITIDTNKMTSNIHIHANKEIASEDNVNLNTPDYTELTEKLNAYDIRITRPIIVIVDLLTEVTKIAINELKEYYNGNT